MLARKASKKRVHSPVEGPKMTIRPCGKAGCPAEQPECFANGVERLVALVTSIDGFIALRYWYINIACLGAWFKGGMDVL